MTDRGNADHEPKENHKHERGKKINSIDRLGEKNHYELQRKMNHVHGVREAPDFYCERSTDLNSSETF